MGSRLWRGWHGMMPCFNTSRIRNIIVDIFLSTSHWSGTFFAFVVRILMFLEALTRTTFWILVASFSRAQLENWQRWKPFVSRAFGIWVCLGNSGRNYISRISSLRELYGTLYGCPISLTLSTSQSTHRLGWPHGSLPSLFWAMLNTYESFESAEGFEIFRFPSWTQTESFKGMNPFSILYGSFKGFFSKSLYESSLASSPVL